jgi:hypothetical protein
VSNWYGLSNGVTSITTNGAGLVVISNSVANANGSSITNGATGTFGVNVLLLLACGRAKNPAGFARALISAVR